jgi:hypothetical protein
LLELPNSDAYYFNDVRDAEQSLNDASKSLAAKLGRARTQGLTIIEEVWDSCVDLLGLAQKVSLALNQRLSPLSRQELIILDQVRQMSLPTVQPCSKRRRRRKIRFASATASKPVALHLTFLDEPRTKKTKQRSNAALTDIKNSKPFKGPLLIAHRSKNSRLVHSCNFNFLTFSLSLVLTFMRCCIVLNHWLHDKKWRFHRWKHK